jgi:hypothetical protein
VTSHKGENYAFRNDVILAHVEAGFTSAHRPAERHGGVGPRHLHGDILGLPITIGVRNSVTIDLPGSLRQVRAEAAAEGHDTFVSIQRYRGASDVLDSFTCLDLRTWLQVLRRLHPEALHS